MDEFLEQLGKAQPSDAAPSADPERAQGRTAGSTMDEIIAELGRTFEAEEAVRAGLSVLHARADDAVRVAERLVGALHTSPAIGAASATAGAALPRVGDALRALQAALPAEDAAAYYRYNDIWRRTLQNAVCACVVVRFTQDWTLADVASVRAMLGAEETALTVPLEDYLVGVLGAVAVLARLCMNRVTLADFDTPVQCARFANELFEGFKELNFRNDFLRKKYDGMKYDVKRIEEIMYDLSIRGLLKSGVEDGKVVDSIMQPAPAEAAEPQKE